MKIYIRKMSLEHFPDIFLTYNFVRNFCAITCTVVTNFKLYIIDSIFACSLSLLNTPRKVLNISFALFTFFIKLIYPFLEYCPEFSIRKNVQNMSDLRVQISDMKNFWTPYLIFFSFFGTFSGHIRTFSMTFSEHSFFIGSITY